MDEKYINKAVQENLLKTLKYLISKCEDHNISYIGAYGTVIGAMRHKGIIPWDDDVDLCMFREDYEKLLSLKEEMHKDGYDIVSLSDEGYYLPFAKIVDLNTSVWELEQLPYVIGNYIDIFPIDCFPFSEAELEKMRKRCRRLFYRFQATMCSDGNLKSCLKYVQKRQFGNLLRVMLSFITSKDSAKYLSKYLDFINVNIGQEGENCVYMTSGVPAVFKTSWLNDTIKVPFEDTEIVVPREYDKYLTLLYGDWRTPPPESKQVSHHQRVYLNLREGLTLEQVRQRIAQGERVVL